MSDTPNRLSTAHLLSNELSELQPFHFEFVFARLRFINRLLGRHQRFVVGGVHLQLRRLRSFKVLLCRSQLALQAREVFARLMKLLVRKRQ